MTTLNIDSADVELPVKKISIYQCSPGWEVVPTHGTAKSHHLYEGDSEWFETKSAAISAGRKLFRDEPSAAILNMGMAGDFGREMKIIRQRSSK